MPRFDPPKTPIKTRAAGSFVSSQSKTPLSVHDAADSRLRAAYARGASGREEMAAAADLAAQHGVLRSHRVHAKYMSKRAAWLAACAWDGVDPNAPLVTWTETNPYAARYDGLIR